MLRRVAASFWLVSSFVIVMTCGRFRVRRGTVVGALENVSMGLAAALIQVWKNLLGMHPDG